VHTPIAAFVTRVALGRIKENAFPRDARPRIIYTVHGFHFFEGQRSTLSSFLYRAAERYAIRYTDDLVVMNDIDKIAGQKLVAHTKRKGCSCTLHRIDGTGLDFSTYSSALDKTGDTGGLRGQLEIPEHAFVMGMIAEMNGNKRHSLVIDAAHLLKDYCPKIHFIFMGTGPLKTQLKAKAATMGLENHIHFTGQIDHGQLKRMLLLCDLGILVSKREGLPRSLMEFIASRVAVVGTTTRGITDEVQDPTGTCEPSPQALAALIKRYIENPEKRTTLVKKQYAHATEHYDSAVVIPQYLKLYEAHS